MKKCFQKLILAVVCVLACAAGMNQKALAKAKVVQVTKTAKHKNFKQKWTIEGKSKSGKRVWAYKSSWATATELSSVSVAENKKYVYIIEDGKFIKLNRQTGKTVVKRKLETDDLNWSATMLIDSKGNLYASGYYSDTVYKLSGKGKKIWECKVKSACCWPYKMRCAGGRLVVYYEGEASPNAVIHAKSGRIIGYR